MDWAMASRVEFSGGKATKLSKYGMTSKDRMERAFWSAELSEKAGLAYHVIDSEWKLHYLMPHETQELVAHSKNLRTIFSFSSRHYGSLKLLLQTLNALKNRDKVGLNVVVGNPAYLDWRELRRPSIRTLVDSIKFIRKNFNDISVLVGTEGLTGTAAELAADYDLVPFLLLDRNLEEEVATVRDRIGNGNLAIYVPFLISENYPRLLHDILFRLSGYILRRRWVQNGLRELGYDPALPTIRAVVQEKQPLSPELMASSLGEFLKKAASTLTVYGNADQVTERLKTFKKLGLKIIIGLPIKESDQQIASLGECVRKAA